MDKKKLGALNSLISLVVVIVLLIMINILGNKAIINGNVNFKAAELMATDLRASVSLILAALSAKGKSIINRIYHLDRGYEEIEQKLRSVGANIRRISE
jgi:UDP-N-acetylglucosamine 1-carboxyvinyltransferase